MKQSPYAACRLAALLTMLGAGALTVSEASASTECRPEWPDPKERPADIGTLAPMRMMVLVGATAEVADIKLLKSTGHRGFDRAAMRAVAACKLAPAMQDGAPVMKWTEIVYTWPKRLDEQPAAIVQAANP